MAKVIVTKSKLDNLATSISTKSGVSTPMTLDAMKTAVDSMSSSGITPTGTINITTNGTHDVTQYASASVNVSSSSPNLQAKTNITPTTSSQTITADSGYDGLSSVQINSMPTGSASTPATTITANPSISVNSSGLITATASASKSVTPSVTAGYVSSGTSGTVSVSGSSTEQLSTQGATTITPTTSSQTAVSAGKYTTGAVTVAAIPSQYVVPSGTKTITQNATGIDVTSYASVDVNVPTGGDSGMNVQGYIGMDYSTSTSYDATDVTLTVAKTGTYTVSWMGFRNTTSGTSGSQLYVNESSRGSAQTTFTRNYGQEVTLTGIALNKGDVLVVHARARSASYYMYVGNLIIEQTA